MSFFLYVILLSSFSCSHTLIVAYLFTFVCFAFHPYTFYSISLFFSLKSFFFNLPAFVFLFPVYKEKVLFCFMLVLVVNFLTLCITQSFANYLSSGFCVILICYFVFYTFTVYWLYIACVKKDQSLCLLQYVSAPAKL